MKLSGLSRSGPGVSVFGVCPLLPLSRSSFWGFLFDYYNLAVMLAPIYLGQNLKHLVRLFLADLTHIGPPSAFCRNMFIR